MNYFYFNRKKAIANLNKQITKLSDRDYLESLIWRNETTAYIEKYFGKQSSQFRFIEKFTFYDFDE